MTENQTPYRAVRSFVRREGRLTAGQQRALDELFPRYGVEPGEGVMDWPTLFGRSAPVVLDIGFGDGEALAEIAYNHPERDYLGVEVHRPGVGRLLRQLDEAGIPNVRVAVADAVELMRDNIAAASLAGIQLFYPDPWPKKRHHKRRIVQPAWLELAASRLADGGFLHMTTDWSDYAEHMLEVIGSSQTFDNIAGEGRFAPDPGERPPTKFERRGLERGHRVHDIILRRRPRT